jgi:hypothetical protein
MRQVLIFALIILALYFGYILTVDRRAEDARREVDRAERVLIEAPTKVKEWVGEAKGARDGAEAGYGEEKGIVVSVSSDGVEIEEEGVRKSYRVAEGTSLEGIVPGSRVLFRLSGGEIVEIRAE